MVDPPSVKIDGAKDLHRAAAELAERLPAPLAPLTRLAYNYRWSWLAGGPELFRSVDAERFELSNQNPVRMLMATSSMVLHRAAGDGQLLEHAEALEAQVTADLDRPANSEVIDPEHPVAYLSAEFAIHVSLPIYSGGLGALAGDVLKEASDAALPMVAVGLMYRKGYFRQRIDASGWQHEYWIETDPERLPAALVRDAEHEPVTVTVPIYGNDVVAQIWRVDVGRVPLFLLDSDIPANGQLDRWITARLYEADGHTRLAQYVLLGVGGIRALRAIGIEPGIVHLNEGHAALAPLELARPDFEGGKSSREALEAARRRTVFTTHTPVAAGNDTYPPEQVEEAIGRLATDVGLSQRDLFALGRTHEHDGSEPFGVTQAALRMSRAANGVSRRHGEVARAMWSPMWSDRSVDQVPIRHVTNGVHVPTWIGPPMRDLLDKYLGADWFSRAADPSTWAGVDDIPDGELWEARERQRAELVRFVRVRSVSDRLARSDSRDYVLKAAKAFDDDVLTLGFARRVATYKRLDLLMRDLDWTMSILGGERRIQVVLAGKAHPKDDPGKRALQRLFELKQVPIVGERVVFLDDYDLASGVALTRGCDVWLNLPRPPLEASGTSGMKSVMNGGLQLSVLDGWWAEGYNGENGWAIGGEVDFDHDAQDKRDSDTFHRLLANEVLPSFCERDEHGLSRAWLRRIRNSLRTLGPAFSGARMVNDYVQGPYRG